MKGKQEECVIWSFLKIDLSIIISMKRSRRELSIDVAIQRVIFRNYLFALFSSKVEVLP